MAFARRHPRLIVAELAAIALYTIAAALLEISQLAFVLGAVVLLVALVVAAAVVIGPAERAAREHRREQHRPVGA